MSQNDLLELQRQIASQHEAIHNLQSVSQAVRKYGVTPVLNELFNTDHQLERFFDIVLNTEDPRLAGIVLADTIDEYLTQHYSIECESLAVSSLIEQRLSAIPRVSTAKQIIDEVRPGDLLITATPKEKVWLFHRLLMFGQRSPFTSVKCVMSKDFLIGYGLADKPKNPLAITELPAYVERLSHAVLLRNKHMTKIIAKDVVEYLKKREGLTYALDQLVKSMWNRMVGEGILSMLQTTMEEFEKNKEEFAEPVLCSSIIGMAYAHAGLPIKTDIKQVINLWPKDILLSPDFDTIVRLDR